MRGGKSLKLKQKTDNTKRIIEKGLKLKHVTNCLPSLPLKQTKLRIRIKNQPRKRKKIQRENCKKTTEKEKERARCKSSSEKERASSKSSDKKIAEEEEEEKGGGGGEEEEV